MLINLPIIPEIIPRKIALFTIMLYNTTKLIVTLNKYKKLSATADFLWRRHRYEKYLIVGLSFYKCECILNGLGD